MDKVVSSPATAVDDIVDGSSVGVAGFGVAHRFPSSLVTAVRDKGVTVQTELNGPLKPGTVALLDTIEGVRHRDFVTSAWTDYPVKDVLLRMARR